MLLLHLHRRRLTGQFCRRVSKLITDNSKPYRVTRDVPMGTNYKRFVVPPTSQSDPAQATATAAKVPTQPNTITGTPPPALFERLFGF